VFAPPRPCVARCRAAPRRRPLRTARRRAAPPSDNC